MARFQFLAMSLSLGGHAAPTARRRTRSWVDELDDDPAVGDDDGIEGGPGWYASSRDLLCGLSVCEGPPAD